jgi:hypothetical protein
MSPQCGSAFVQLTLAIALSLHVLSATFWAGSTFALARIAGDGVGRLFAPQMGAAVVAIATGAYLWITLHEAAFGTMERLLIIGALCAIVAVVVQAAFVGGALGTLSKRDGGNRQVPLRVVIAHRVAALLLVVATAAMAAARYA